MKAILAGSLNGLSAFPLANTGSVSSLDYRKITITFFPTRSISFYTAFKNAV
jgi:hypothetical protein